MDKEANDGAILRDTLYGTHAEPTYGGVLSFMRRKYSKDLSGADVAVMGVPFDTATTNRPGTRFGPRAIRAASSGIAWERPYGMEFDPLDKLAVVDYGDCFFEFGRQQMVPQEIEDEAFKIVDQDVSLISLGGDHFIAWPLINAHVRKHGGPLSLLHFDAHSDTWEDEDGRIDHGTMFYHAAKQGVVDPKKSVQVGLRTHNPDTMGFNILDGPWVHENGVNAVVTEIKKVIGNDPVYVSFDIDCLDPSYAPGTGTPVCGGLTSYQALSILRGLRGINILGADIVEVSPAYDVGEITALAGAQIAAEFLCLMASR